ncbi:FAD-dependent oxidoreductase [Amycolatopsis echigonensis]|uniref:FAD-dependent oxidoreductase n=1 Tax=Amycolatopsis echigonensis TaxID=2576905 RepID=A0A8E1W660_9PSEU|nr:FAD-dependent oxidoreductase [Amycolatopsis echigonensis]MBB2504403.1 FAD-dependent oxidoreductase [Amycolatopsis echigonensis]
MGRSHVRRERDDMTDHRTGYDVVVLGAGIAGLTVALSAVEHGLSVALLEKTAAVGGSSVMSGGFFAFSGTDEQRAHGVGDSAEAFLKDLLEVGAHRNDPALLQQYLDHQQDTYRWLKAHGAEFPVVEISSGQSFARSHHTPIRTLIPALAEQFTEAGGTLLCASRATELVRDAGGRVGEVVAETPDGLVRFAARRGVVIASGGFSRGEELLAVFAPDQLAAIPYGGLGNTGDGLRMAWKLGAGMADMSAVCGTYGSHPDTGIEFHELLTAYYLGAIIVNTAGRRFVDESISYKSLGAACLAQPEGLGFQVFDAVVRARSHPGVPLNDIGMLEEIGHVHRAGTLEGLAEAAGIDPAGLVSTVERYNAAVAGGEPDEQGRTGLVNGVGELVPVVEPPFYAYPAKTLMTTTYCGVTIDPHGRVLDVDGAVIPGLSAIGEVTGGFHGAAYMTGTSLGKGAVFGRIVAARLAAEAAAAA